MNLAFLGVVALAMKDNIGSIAENCPDGLYKRSFGKWAVTLNGKLEPNNAGGVTLPALTILAEFNGWPSGEIDPRGGIIAAGELANENTFIAAIEEELGHSIEDAFYPPTDNKE